MPLKMRKLQPIAALLLGPPTGLPTPRMDLTPGRGFSFTLVNARGGIMYW